MLNIALLSICTMAGVTIGLWWVGLKYPNTKPLWVITLAKFAAPALMLAGIGGALEFSGNVGVSSPLFWAMYVLFFSSLGIAQYLSPARPDELSIADLGRLARDRGWNFSDHARNEVTDFQNALRAAAAKGPEHGGLVIAGRENGYEYPELHKDLWPCSRIPAEHFKRALINAGHNFPDGDNFLISTMFISGNRRGTFRDLVVLDRHKAIKWVKSINGWRGGAQEAARIESQRRALRSGPGHG
jgi:hypothetical protein